MPPPKTRWIYPHGIKLVGRKVRVRVRGERACFTRPELKTERVSYDVMTPSAARGVLEAVHWKPAIRWIVDKIHVLKPLRRQTILRNEVDAKLSTVIARDAMRRNAPSLVSLGVDTHRQPRTTSYLVDVDYLIEARIVLTPRASAEDTLAKHQAMFLRRAAAGQCFQHPYLGLRECVADLELFPRGAAPPRSGLRGEDGDRELGFMLWDIDYDRDCEPIFFPARLHHGVLDVGACLDSMA